METNRSKAALSGRRRVNRYETHPRKGKSFLRDRNKRDGKVRQRIAGKQPTERQHGPEENRQENLLSGMLKPIGRRTPKDAVSSKSKKPKPKVLELPGNLGEEQLPAVTAHCLTKQMPGRTEDRRKVKKTGT